MENDTIGIDSQFLIQSLADNREAIKAHVKKVILDGISKQFQWELPQVVTKEVSKFMEEEIVPEIRKQLIADKDLIVEAATKAVQGIAIEVGTSLQKLAAEQLSNSYKVREIGKALFAGY